MTGPSGSYDFITVHIKQRDIAVKGGVASTNL